MAEAASVWSAGDHGGSFRAKYTENANIYDDPTRFWHHGAENRIYIIIDLKSFYASVECVERGLDPMTAKLVVADPDRSGGTICLAVSPALKALGVRNRCRVYEIPAHIDYIMAPPQMQHYMDCSADIYEVYLQYIAKEDIHIYSVDEAFMDVTDYLDLYGMTAKELGNEIMNAVYDRTGIRSTCGIGTNMYLAKIALDITAKHSPDFIGILDEDRYKALLWDHRPITDFWMIASGTSRRLSRMGIHTMREIAAAAMADDRLLYREFGVNAEILIDHAFGRETVGISDIRNYRIKSKSLSTCQVLLRDYSFEETRVIISEMTDKLCLQMADRKLVTDSVTLTIVYSRSWADPSGFPAQPSKGTVRAPRADCSDMVWRALLQEEYEKIARRDAPIRTVGIWCNRVRSLADSGYQYGLLDEQGNLYADFSEGSGSQDKARRIMSTVINIRNRYGKNSILKGVSLDAAGTMMERNNQIGGHKSGTMDRVVKEKLQREDRLTDFDRTLRAEAEAWHRQKTGSHMKTI